jgi:hypothetical protein
VIDEQMDGIPTVQEEEESVGQSMHWWV